MKHGAFFLIHKPKNNHSNGTHQKKVRLDKSEGKVMLVVSFDYQGLVYYEFIKEGITINKQAYKEILVRLRDAIIRKRNQLFKSKQWKLLHDNVPAHRAIIFQDYLAKHSVSVLPHPPYSPDIAPCDFFFFSKLKMTLKGRRFSSSSEVIENATKPTPRNQLFKSKQWKLLHDNVPAHRAIIFQDYLAKHSVSVLPHPPYSPDIAPCDFFFFSKLKMTLKGRRFSSSSEVIENATKPTPRNQLFKSKQWKLLHDNVPAHRAIIFQDYLAKHSVSVLPHPPYSPDIAPCDFFFFSKLKMTLKGRRFSSSSEVIENATVELNKLRKIDFELAFQQLFSHWKKNV
ncbi:hypothetical protein LAZ67_21002238 [Cordylochernes scorpioides]|uniref:Transposase n=1 Tax=Cordylochernes scorpioides TaxID=51811 RepID=A0ABY6LRJ1_9ARAC|nr:hypothetical protein LAZ67_21002238 [Cordylochernes scorpioides]